MSAHLNTQNRKRDLLPMHALGWSRNCFQNSENATVIERVVC